ncbi:hypothetical protein K439DRAFT_1623443 [Ramaria rubella]|nr:hypothetical protein K439DRAFT_1623443 [Ramaria rubella]
MVLIQGCSDHRPSAPILPAIRLHHCTLMRVASNDIVPDSWAKGFVTMTPAQAAGKCTDPCAQHPPLSSTYPIQQCWPSQAVTAATPPSKHSSQLNTSFLPCVVLDNFKSSPVETQVMIPYVVLVELESFMCDFTANF